MPRSKEPTQCTCYAYASSCNHVKNTAGRYEQCTAMANLGNRYCVPCLLDREKRGYGTGVSLLARVRKAGGTFAIVPALKADGGLVLLKLDTLTQREFPGFKYGLLHEASGRLVAVGIDLRQTRHAMRVLRHSVRVNGERIDWTAEPRDEYREPCQLTLTAYYRGRVRLAIDVAAEQRQPRDTGEDAIPKV